MQTNDNLSRREFLSRSMQFAGAAAVAGGTLASGANASINPQGANDRVNVAVVGIRNRGSRHIEGYSSVPNVHIKTLVDIDENLFPNRVKFTEKLQGSAPTTEVDLRRSLEDPDIDAISIATPNHWHALQTVWGCQAGKHVYVEKPIAHGIWEGRKMVEAARKYDRIVQVGTQSRSSDNVRSAIKFIHEGGLGDIYMARGLCIKARPNIGRYPDGPVNESPTEDQLFGYFPDMRIYPIDKAYLNNVNYDLWLGPAPERPFNLNHFHYNWHWHWEYGNGDIGNTGPHQFDIARWGLNREDAPVKVKSTGGYYVFDSSQETPNTQAALFEYADGTILEFEVRGHFSNSESNVTIGNLFFGSEGWMEIGGGGWKTYFGQRNEPGPSSDSYPSEYTPDEVTGGSAGGHFGNFITAIRSDDQSLLEAEIHEGQRSNVLPHMANISYRLGREVSFDGLSETFMDDSEANKMLKRAYRDPYVVPDKV